MNEGITNPLDTLRGFGENGKTAALLIERFITDLDHNGLHAIRAFSLGAVVKAGPQSTDFACVSYESGSELLLKGLAAHRAEAQAIGSMKRDAREGMASILSNLMPAGMKCTCPECTAAGLTDGVPGTGPE